MATHELKLVAKRVICEGVMELDFALPEVKEFSFIPGQFINIYARVRPQESHTGRSYTIASVPGDSFIRIAVRKRGEFSTFLHGLSIGDEVITDGPHGILCPSQDNTPFICLAAGIGICPFLSWIRSRSQTKGRIHVLVTNSTETRSPYVVDILNYSSKDYAVSMTSFLTQQHSSFNHKSILRRINAQDIKDALLELPRAMVAICGSISFTHDMWKATLSLGVPEERILTEAFY
jgi:ferredoxin-NADP reductase